MNIKEYLLVCLIEECQEVSHAACKALRFGMEDKHPETGISNQEKVKEELMELMTVVNMLEEDGLSFRTLCENILENKKFRVLQYMEYSRKKGILYD